MGVEIMVTSACDFIDLLAACQHVLEHGMMDFPLSTRTRVDNDSKDVRDQSFLLVTNSNWDACAGERVGPLRPVRSFF